MRAVFSLFSLVALASTGVFATPISECVSELCGSIPLFDSSPSPADFAASIGNVGTPTRSLPERDIEQLTNAERFVRGLPPKRPKLIQGSSLRRNQPSPVPLTTYRGVVRVDKEDGTGNLGYLSAHTFSGAQYRYQPNLNDAAIVTFKFDPAQTLGPASEFSTENSDIQSTFPTLGLIQGRDNTNSDIASGSFHYLYIGGTTPTSPDATPQTVANSYNAVTGRDRTAESEVWTFNSDTGALTLQWVNTDGSKPTTILWTQGTALYAGGDSGAFVARYPSPITRLTYTFVPL